MGKVKITVKQAAKLIPRPDGKLLSDQTIRRMIKDGRLAGEFYLGHWLVNPEDVLKLHDARHKPWKRK